MASTGRMQHGLAAFMALAGCSLQIKAASSGSTRFDLKDAYELAAPLLGGTRYYSQETRRVRRADLTETVITRVNLPAPANPAVEVIERRLRIRALTKDEFEKY
jgi:hypothetical protein